jgi:hypothetical protein
MHDGSGGYMAVMTWKKLSEQIESGRGQGHRDDFKPWLWVRRKNPSARGNQVTAAMPGYRRASHFMAQVEWHMALLCLWLGASDVREQFPLWPMSHAHPLADLPHMRSTRLPHMPGLLDIAREAGIAHGVEIGSKGVPYVATLDLAVTLPGSQTPKLAGLSLKPHDDVRVAEPTDRMLERLEMERRYLVIAKANHAITDRSLLGTYTGGNLETFSSAARLPRPLASHSLVEDFCGQLLARASNTTICEAITSVGTRMKLAPIDANLLWRHGVWIHAIDLDITHQLRLGEPLALGGYAIATAISQELFGEVLS